MLRHLEALVKKAELVSLGRGERIGVGRTSAPISTVEAAVTSIPTIVMFSPSNAKPWLILMSALRMGAMTKEGEGSGGSCWAKEGEGTGGSCWSGIGVGESLLRKVLGADKKEGGVRPPRAAAAAGWPPEPLAGAGSEPRSLQAALSPRGHRCQGHCVKWTERGMLTAEDDARAP